MCGIVGVFERRGGAVDRELLDRITDRLAHRGPDGRGVYVQGGVGFGHRRLSIIGVSDGAQPMSNEDGTVWVTFNGEIYNYVALKKELEELGHVFRTHADTEVLVHGYETWGRELPERLRGIFAFAIHDQRQNVVFAARDHLGVKPLYYSLNAERFLFASEAKALLIHPEVPKRPDLDGIQLYLRFGYVPAPFSAFAGMRQLEPGRAIEVSEARHRSIEYWRPPPIGVSNGETEDVDQALDRMLDDAVESELMSEVPLGAFLSGGIDSSAVVASMARKRGKSAPPRTFCIGFSQPEYDESPCSERVAKALGLDHKVETASVEDLALLDVLVEVYDEPFADSSAIPTYALCKMARKYVTVALSGDGGDELFAGYGRYKKLAAYFELPPLARRAVEGASRFYPRTFRGARALEMYSGTRGQQYELSISYPAHLLDALVGPEIMRRDPGWSIAALFDAAPGRTPVQKAQWVDLLTYLPSDILVKVDRASMAHALEVRVPLLDYPFVEWACTLPSELTFGDGEGKVILKKHLARRIPRELFERPKMGFGVPLEFWLAGEGGLLRIAERLRSRSKRGQFFAPIDAQAFERLAREPLRNDPTGLIWSLLFLEAWWQKFFV